MEKKELFDNTCNGNFTSVGLRLDLMANLSMNPPSLTICIWIREPIRNMVMVKLEQENKWHDL